jgi:hypothetical protein
MLAVQLRGRRIAGLSMAVRLTGALILISAASASIILAVSSPCSHRQRIWLAGFSLGDQCLASTWP